MGISLLGGDRMVDTLGLLLFFDVNDVILLTEKN